MQNEFFAFFDHTSKLALVLAFLYLVGLAFAVSFAAMYWSRAYRGTWYDPSPFGMTFKPTWNDVYRWMREDPLEFPLKSTIFSRCKIWDPYYSFRLLRDLAILVGAALAFFAVGRWLYEHWYGIPVETVKQVGLLAGGGSLFVTTFGIFYRGRLQARAQNRQAWINSLRDQINLLFARMPGPLATPDRLIEAFEDYQRIHTSLELFLNPSERVHRGFMAVARHLYGIQDLAVDDEARQALDIPLGIPLLGIAGWNMWKSRAIRLANVLLKREWELVKFVR